MFDVNTLHRDEEGEFYATDSHTGDEVVISEMFPIYLWDSVEAFSVAHIRGYEPMTAKELDTEEAQLEKLNDPTYIIEEKFDGTRALVYFFKQGTVDEKGNDAGDVGYCRVFSRRISKKTGFYVENSDSLPHIRETDAPDLAGTIIDGEMFIDGLPFREVASTLNCLWDKAIDRQIEKGFVTFHAFDILFYRGIDLRRFPLHRRKHYLHVVLEELKHPYIKEVEYHQCGVHSTFDFAYDEIMRIVGDKHINQYMAKLEESKDTYPVLWTCYNNNLRLTPKAYYELVVSTGGEGVMVKPIDGRYHHKRGWEYSKIKKFLTRELIVIGFDNPTREYTGKEKKKWAFWENKTTGKKVLGNFYGDQDYEPVTKFYYNSLVGNLLLGVFITKEEYDNMPVNKRGEVFDPECVGIYNYDTNYLLMQVCECSGFNDETREYFTQNKDKMVGTVVEVKANEIFRDSGKLRHPRYLRRRFDKTVEECVWADHIGG